MGQDWMTKARCRAMSPALFFPCDGPGVLAAQRICGGCGVRAQCLDFALTRRITHGVWGGASERERVRLARARRAGARKAAAPGANGVPRPLMPVGDVTHEVAAGGTRRTQLGEVVDDPSSPSDASRSLFDRAPVVRRGR